MDLKTLEHALTIWSIRIAVVCLFTYLIFQPRPFAPRHISRPLIWVWNIGALLSLLHLLFAMGFVHQWSHQLAWEDTAQQTDEFMGVRVGAGIYFNYLFVGIWVFDAIWQWGWTASYHRRYRWAGRLIIGYLLFIAFNGAVVFESGLIRWVTLILLAVWIAKMIWVWPLDSTAPAKEPQRED